MYFCYYIFKKEWYDAPLIKIINKKIKRNNKGECYCKGTLRDTIYGRQIVTLYAAP